MNKKTLWKDIFRSISKSKGRFFSIFGLMLLGSFALVGLKVTGPDMRFTGTDYFDQLNSADITVIGTLGIDDEDTKVIDQAEGVRHVEYGYLKDVAIKDSEKSIRIFSKGENVSRYQVTEGRLPEEVDEIALNDDQRKSYNIGDTFYIEEGSDLIGEDILTGQEFTIVGFVNSAEILSNVSMGPSLAGSGELKGYGVVIPEAFDSPFYMLARLDFEDTVGVDPYSEEYTDKIQAHKDSLDELLKDQPDIRLENIKKEFQEKIDDGQKELDEAKQELADAREKLASGKLEIQDGKEQIESAQKSISDSEKKLADAREALNAAEGTLNEKWGQLQAGKAQLDEAKQLLDAGYAQLQQAPGQLAAGREQLAAAQGQINQKEAELSAAKEEYNAKKEEFNQAKKEYDSNKSEYDSAISEVDSKEQQLSDGKNKYESSLDQISNGIDQVVGQMNQIDQQLAAIGNMPAPQPELEIDPESEEAEVPAPAPNTQGIEEQIQQLNQQKAALSAKHDELVAQQSAVQSEYDDFMSGVYEPGMAQINEAKQEMAPKKEQLDQASDKISSGQQQLDQASSQISDGESQLAAAKETVANNQQVLAAKEQEYQAALSQYNQGVASYNENLNVYYAGLAEWTQGAETLDVKSAEYQENVGKLEEAKKELADKQGELADAEDELAEKQKEFDEKEPDAEQEIKDAQEKLKDAQEALDQLTAPVYRLNSRREIPGGEGYKIYGSISNIVDSLANIFPIFLYFVAALVTSTTIARFVDEERINSGTLKALGYSNKDVLKKFTFYGLSSSLLGTIIGVILGHTLLPFIVYNAYGDAFALPKIQFHFNPWISLTAVLLATISSVGPAWLVAAKELKERPSVLLLPKPPAEGSKILLERIPFIWNRLSFTHKVTARNIFRYKKRMFMTIFGVAGAVSALFTGFSVQHSVGGISERQFSEIIQYDMIVAENDQLPEDQKTDIEDQLNDPEVKESLGVYFENVTKVAGVNKDTQEIKLIVPSDIESLDQYIYLNNRKTNEALTLSDEGVIISERLATLLDVEEGDEITLNDSNEEEHQMKVSGITEMYMGHFAFTTKAGYESIFGEDYHTNAYLVNLNNSSLENVEKQAAKFMELSEVQGVVQNTSLISQIHTIVNSLNKIMGFLIVVATLLGLVILYNLTNINISERIRELSTIKVLGFVNKEVTMYIYRETILLTGLGILVGFSIGELLHQYIITVVPPDDVMFNPALGAGSFLIPTIITVIITAALGFMVNNRLRNVDMLEALKSVD